MIVRLLIALLLAAVVAPPARAQADLFKRLSQSSRVAVLPFTNYSGEPAALTEVMPLVQEQLQRRAADLVDPASVSAALRGNRIRNTSELASSEMLTLAAELNARYLLIGTIDRYSETDSVAEVAVSARLLDAASSSVAWAGWESKHFDPRPRFLKIGGAGHADILAQQVTRQLFQDFAYARPARDRVVRGLLLNGKRQPAVPCRKVAVVTFGNESPTNFAGNLIAGALLAALYRRGFELVDPGRVREVMLAERNVMQGEISVDLLRRCREELQADFVLTGTVSRFETAPDEAGDAPSIAVDARLIDAASGSLVWGRSLTREGRDSAGLFDIGYCHGLTPLCMRLARTLVATLPAQRVRPERSAPAGSRTAALTGSL